MRESETHRSTQHQRPYAMKLHDATGLHWDLRLAGECGVYSWALPLGPSLTAGIAREAIVMDDHRRANITFEGCHETGTIMLWDRGLWAPEPGFEDVRACLDQGFLPFELYGERITGAWILSRVGSTGNGRPHWVLIKQPDSLARNHGDGNILEEFPNSVITGRTLQEIESEWLVPKTKHEQQAKLFQVL